MRFPTLNPQLSTFLSPFTAEGTETLSVSREAGRPLDPKSRQVGAVFDGLSHKSVKIC